MGKIDRVIVVDNINKKLREKSGSRATTSIAIDFFYLLMRDKLPTGVVQHLLNEVKANQAAINESGGGDIRFTNGYLADYAKFIVEELLEKV